REIDGRDIGLIHGCDVRTVEDIKTLSKQLKILVLAETDPLRNTQVCEPGVWPSEHTTKDRDPQRTACTQQGDRRSAEDRLKCRRDRHVHYAPRRDGHNWRQLEITKNGMSDSRFCKVESLRR